MIDKKLKEFVTNYYGESWETESDIQFAQAVAAFTEERVLEEIKEEIGISVDCEKCEELEARLALKRKQLEAFLPGGAVERMVNLLRTKDLNNLAKIDEARIELEALLQKKEGK